MSRIERVNELIKQELGQILLREINLEEGVFVTIIEIKTSIDLQHANVLVSVFPTEKSQKILEILEKNIYRIQQLLNKRLSMRPVPKIKFKIDKTGEKLERIDKLLKEL